MSMERPVISASKPSGELLSSAPIRPPAIPLDRAMPKGILLPLVVSTAALLSGLLLLELGVRALSGHGRRQHGLVPDARKAQLSQAGPEISSRRERHLSSEP